jgi:ABC-2 type transport system permease protein
MNPTTLRSGITQGLIELRQSFTGSDLIGNLFWPLATLVAIFLLRHRHIDGTDLGLGTLILPGVLGMFVALGMLLTVQNLAADREDGTLLRAKAIPNGVRGYLIGKLITAASTSTTSTGQPSPGCCYSASWPPSRSAPSSDP